MVDEGVPFELAVDQVIPWHLIREDGSLEPSLVVLVVGGDQLLLTVAIQIVQVDCKWKAEVVVNDTVGCLLSPAVQETDRNARIIMRSLGALVLKNSVQNTAMPPL